MCREIYDYFKNKKVLILGFGREGKSTYNYIRKFDKDFPIAIADKNEITVDDENVTLICGEKYLDAINEYDLVMKSPGISLRDFTVRTGTVVTCQTDLFLKFAPLKKIGITGTKGKTTTSNLIYEIVKAAGINACMIGNMGIPVFDSLGEKNYDVAVIEMSSHQLEYTHTSPDIAVVTNVYPEHLDHYNGFSGYVNAKLNILRYQNKNDFFVYNGEQGLDEFIDIEKIPAKRKGVKLSDAENDKFLTELVSSNERLLGDHNKIDILYAATVARFMGISDEAILKGIQNFGGIEHRMEPVGTFKGIEFYNDCIATIPQATIFAVKAFGNISTLIVGGMDRGIDYSLLENELVQNPLDNIICLPDTGHKLADKLNDMGCKSYIFKAKDMEDAVRKAFEVTKSGRGCILSPAASSYNVYKNFEYKGRHFKELVSEYGKE